MLGVMFACAVLFCRQVLVPLVCCVRALCGIASSQRRAWHMRLRFVADRRAAQQANTEPMEAVALGIAVACVAQRGRMGARRRSKWQRARELRPAVKNRRSMLQPCFYLHVVVSWLLFKSMALLSYPSQPVM